MKSFKSIKEGNYAEPGVSSVEDVPEDPLSYVEIKPKKSKIVSKQTEKMAEALNSVSKLVQKFQTVRRHAVAKSRAKKLVTASKSASAAGDKMAADAAMSKSMRYSNIAKGMKEQMNDNKPISNSDKSSSSQIMGDNKMINRAASRLPKKPADEYDRKVTSYLKKKYNEETEQMDEKHTAQHIKMAIGVAKDKRYAGGNMSGAVRAMEKINPGLSKHPRVQQVLKSTNEGIDFLKIWNDIKPVYEEVKTTHEDPLVVTKDAEGNIHTHANLSVANAIHGTNVKHQAIHTGKPVQDGNFTFQLSKHHEGALKEDAPFDAAAHKKEHDKLMGKHMTVHAETSKLITAKAPQEQINKANERLNAVKQEIRNHKDKVPKGPAPKKDGGPGDYYASKKPGEYTGD